MERAGDECGDNGAMVRGAASATTDGYLAALLTVAPGAQIAAVYAVGSLALGDFSERQSNFDLVVVADPRLDAVQIRRLSRAVRVLHRAGRDARVWYVTWEDLDAGGPGSLAGEPDEGSPLATPMTRAILRHDPMALLGPDWPVVAHDPDVLKAWCSERLRNLAATDHGLLVMRRAIGPLVLEAARLAQGSITGRVLSKSEAGEATVPIVSSSHQRVLVDAVGYRRGAQTSMYWGPFERKYDALALVRELLDAAVAPGSPPTGEGR
jgi:hypothetical protein